MKKLYLMRHGQTEFNVAKLVQGQCDSPLTEAGERQARAAAAWLAGYGVSPDEIVTSPLGRACATARIVAESIGFTGEVEPEPGIIERAYGIFEGGPHTDLPTDVWDPGEQLVPYGGEGNKALEARMVAALRARMGADNVETLLAVSHGSACRQFIRSANPAPDQLPGRLPNCAIMIFDYTPGTGVFTFDQVIDPAKD